MLFNSIEFLLFLPVVFLLYWFVFRHRKIQNLFLVIASYIFYGWWDWRFLLLITLTSFCSFWSGILIVRFNGNRGIQKIVSASNIIFNLMILAIFKYYDFFMVNLETLFHSFGYQMDWVTLDIILPVGISFYTFQALSYTIDVYQKKFTPTKDIVEFFAYISFFPQLVAGPIERATSLLPQFQNERRFNYAIAVDGMRQMLWGFFKKLVIADNCAFAVNSFWDSYPYLPGCSIILLGVLFTFQIYCDFSGYSDIAIGCAKLFGINLMRNFNYPYFSRSIPEFWRRWHISLMTWFRDYIYFPLGGNKCVRWKVIRNTLIVFLVSGLWHGASWTFVCWGIYHACLIALFIMFGVNTKANGVVAYGRFLPTIKEIGEMGLTFILVVFGFVIFRAESLGQLWDIVNHIIKNNFFSYKLLYGKTFFVYALIMIIIEYLQREKQHALQLPNNWLFRKKIVRWALYAVICFFIVIKSGRSQDFIYFQF